MNGTEASLGEYPAVGYLQITYPEAGRTASCGGTLVASTRFLTAAQCVIDGSGAELPATAFQILLGAVDLTVNPKDLYGVTAVDAHDQFGIDDSGYANDVAMLTLDRAAPYTPMRIVGTDEGSKWAAGTQATIVGWGTTFQGGGYSNDLLEAQFPIVSDQDCLDAYATATPGPFDPATMVCAGDSTDTIHGACLGDTGGPLLVPDGASFVLAGVISWGIGCADPNHPDIHARIGADPLNDWVRLRADTAAPLGAAMAALGAFRKATTFTVAWSAGDAGSGIDDYDVRVRVARWNGTFGPRTLFRDDTSTTSAPFSGAAGRTYCFSVRARDRAGNVSSYSPERCTAVPLDDRSLARTGTWSSPTAAGYYLGTASRSSSRGASLTKGTVQAKRLALLVTKCPTCGTVKVLWNGTTLATINLATTDGLTRNKQVIALPAFTGVQTGSFKLMVTSTGKQVSIDGVFVSRT